jgi:hypothetical protein
MRHLIFALILCSCAPALADGSAADPVVASDHAAGSAATVAPVPAPAKPSASLANPATDPIEAWSDAKAAKKIGWVALVFALATMLAMGVGTIGKNISKLAWLNKGRAAVVVGGVAAIGAAGFDVAVQGGSPVALGLALWTAGLAYYQRATAE